VLCGALVAGAVGVVAGAEAPARAASGDFTVSPTSLSFPDTYVGSTSSMAVTITNGSTTTQTPNFAGGAPNDPTNFGGSQNCAGVALDPGASCQFTYTFEPSSPGGHSSATTIGIDGDNFSISMSGNGVFPFTVAPTDVAFPDTAVGDTSSVPVVITNISSTSLTPNYAGGAPNDPTNFGGSQNCAGVALSGGQSCQFTYTFTPNAPGPWTSSTTIDIDGQSFAISLHGTGTDSSNTTTTSTTTSTTAPTTTTTTTTTTNTTSASSPSTSLGSSGTLSTAPTVTAAADLGPVALGHAEVITQGVITFGDASVVWSAQALTGAALPFAFSNSPAMFLVAGGPNGILVQGDGGMLAKLDAGEGVFVPAGGTGTAAPFTPGAAATATADRITLEPGSGPASFTPGPGLRDVNIVRDVVAPGETFNVSSDFPVLVMLSGGDLVDVAGTAGTLPAGVITALAPHVSLRNDGTVPAVVVAGVLGASLA
jgi:hypothetical protein